MDESLPANQPAGQDFNLGPYVPYEGIYDEYVAPDGSIRPHWLRFMGQFNGLSPEDRVSAHETANRLLLEDGVTIISHDAADGHHTPWQLDPLPFLIDEAEWAELEAGLIQRATVLNAILSDLYGEQSLLKDGRLPAGLVLGNPKFLRACHGLRTPKDTHLHLLGFDLARGLDGRWWVLNDRTQSPTGLGYLLENRLITSRSLPELFSAGNVVRLASVFQAFNDYIRSLSGKDEPLVVVLSPGPGIETYFEHAYLARYLGFIVVEGADLTVRDDRVFLKTVEGLRPVDLIFRRTDSEYCDPLELRTDSQWGVPGLLRAARAGNVAVINALGSGALENEGLNSFLPSICRHMLGEEMLLPSIATWWCGQPKEKDYVLANLDRLVIRKAFSNKTIMSPYQESYFAPSMTPQDQDALRENIVRYGYDYVGQEFLALSTAPSWRSPNTLGPANLTLRVFVVKTADGYKAVPGGLARVSDEPLVHGQLTGQRVFTKDTWVESSAPIDTFSLLSKARAEMAVKRGSRNLPSRTADNLYWLGRYAERAEGAMRLYRSLVLRLGGEQGVASDPKTMDLIIKLLVSHKHLSPRNVKKVTSGGIQEIEQELWKILFDAECPDGLATVLSNVKRTADLVRDRLSVDIWRIIGLLSNSPEHTSLRQGQEISDALRFLDQMVQYLSAFNGMVMENMTRNSGWRFLDMGRRMERAYRGINLIRDLAAQSSEDRNDGLDILLELADSTITYRTRYQSVPQMSLVLDLLMSDDTNPRSVLYQFTTLDDHIGQLAPAGDDGTLSQPKRIVLGIRTDLRLAEVEDLVSIKNKRGARSKLNQLLKRVDKGIEDLSEVIGQTYFVHSAASRVSGPSEPKAEL